MYKMHTIKSKKYGDYQILVDAEDSHIVENSAAVYNLFAKYYFKEYAFLNKL
jgi:hypothetical protein